MNWSRKIWRMVFGCMSFDFGSFMCEYFGKRKKVMYDDHLLYSTIPLYLLF